MFHLVVNTFPQALDPHVWIKEVPGTERDIPAQWAWMEDGLIDSDRELLACLVRTSARGMAAEEGTESDV